MSKRFKNVKFILCSLALCVCFIVGSISMEAYAAQFTVTANMSSLSFAGAAQAEAGSDYNATISNNGGCSLPSSITVTVGGTTLAKGSSTYTYSPMNGNVVIKGEAITGNIVISAAATTHQWSAEDVLVVGPSCTTQGVTSKYCKVCGATSGNGGVSPTGHKFVNYVSNKDATCSKDGTKTATCSNPGCTQTSTITDTGSRLSHTTTGKRVNVKVATCTEEGYTGDMYCECGARVRAGEKIPVTDHDGIVMGKKNPSCIIDGYTGDTICRYCDEVLATGTVINALEEHSYGEWNTVLEATDLKIGRKERICSMCGMKESELIPARELGEYILPILLIGVIIVGGCVGCGFAIFFAIKKLKKAAELQEMPTQEMSEEIAEAIIVTGESGNNEIL